MKSLKIDHQINFYCSIFIYYIYVFHKKGCVEIMRRKKKIVEIHILDIDNKSKIFIEKQISMILYHLSNNNTIFLFTIDNLKY